MCVFLFVQSLSLSLSSGTKEWRRERKSWLVRNNSKSIRHTTNNKNECCCCCCYFACSNLLSGNSFLCTKHDENTELAENGKHRERYSTEIEWKSKHCTHKQFSCKYIYLQFFFSFVITSIERELRLKYFHLSIHRMCLHWVCVCVCYQLLNVFMLFLYSTCTVYAVCVLCFGDQRRKATQLSEKPTE